MSTKTKAKTTKPKKENLEALPLPTLWERFTEATGERTRSPNKKFLARCIEEARARVSEPEPMVATKESASMTIKELRVGSGDRRYLNWKIRETQKPLDVKILPLRLHTELADKMDEVWQTKGIKSRMEFLRGAIGRYLAQLGAHDVAALFASRGSMEA
jgi:hypothetical protein